MTVPLIQQWLQTAEMTALSVALAPLLLLGTVGLGMLLHFLLWGRWP